MSWLEHMVFGLSTIPEELVKSFRDLRELDKESRKRQLEIEEEERVFVLNIRHNIENGGLDDEEGAIRLFDDIKEKRSNLAKRMDIQLKLSQSIYERLDSCINALDENINSINNSVHGDVSMADTFTPKLKKKKGEAVDDTSGSRSTGKNKKQSGGHVAASNASGAVDQPREAFEIKIYDEGFIDPNEPVYCSCRQVSFGKMVGCENLDCQYEWFHYACVGLTEEPPANVKWYCEDCRSILSIK